MTQPFQRTPCTVRHTRQCCIWVFFSIKCTACQKSNTIDMFMNDKFHVAWCVMAESCLEHLTHALVLLMCRVWFVSRSCYLHPYEQDTLYQTRWDIVAVLKVCDAQTNNPEHPWKGGRILGVNSGFCDSQNSLPQTCELQMYSD